MAVTDTEVAGYISAGCVDGDIIFQAREALKDGLPRTLVYGEGSPFKDISLPCGGAIEIKIIPRPDRESIKVQLPAKRQPFDLSLEGLKLRIKPALSLRLVGRGAPFLALANLAVESGFIVHGQSPDQELRQSAFERFDHLIDPKFTPEVQDDPYRAVVFLFHDHEWEPALLRQALDGGAFYIGAMGSSKTHAARLESLTAIGVKDISRIRGPIGLIPAMRDAQHLAISILADIIREAQRRELLP